MEGFTLVDGVVAAVILISAILAYSRGFVREGMSIVGWVAAAVLAYIFAPRALPLIKEVPVLKDFIGDSCELSMIAAFAGVFALALVLVSIFTPLFSSAVQRSALGGLDQALGFIFGVLRGLILVAIALVVYDRIVTTDTIPMVDDSRTAKIFARTQDQINEQIPEDAPGWIVEKYENLVGTCSGGETPSTAPAEPTGTDS
ncbi:membrane protein required for colicin V production [Aliiroseovarius halocynthiae]|uniref:CvpA family protein n=1 Tax=Aliiroseovarius halocynthiae TaxID=985055 RepID=A0A545SWZ6_9RHOB|nr:CvpA family protein [Aliiroseovarius halocynthiae]TQV69474.1 CvpA family protein [Aliiroseovarius halocynthiae]SMR72872.1 membrane protein required for colicin V production [Aliiroseovarius halocynthiae]